VFLDYNPEFFVPILNCLRAMKYATPGNPPSFPQLREGQMKDFKRFIQYLGLSGEIFPHEKFNQHSSTVTLQEGGTVAVHGPNYEHSYVLGENIYQQGIVRLKMKLESFQDNQNMLVGMLYHRITIHLDGLVHMDGHSGIWSNMERRVIYK
jgi:hypothetical protein